MTRFLSLISTVETALWALVLSLSVSACTKNENDAEDSPPSTPFVGVVSFNLSISSSTVPANCGEAITLYTSEYQTAYTAGARGAQTAAPWVALENDGDNLDAGEDAEGFNLVMVSNSYFGLNAIAGYGFSSIFFNLPSLTHTGRKMPSDISALAFNHATVKTRYRRAIDKVLPYLSSSVKYFSLGNEVDTYFNSNPSEWAAYKELIEDARTYLKSLKPDIIVGVTTTFDGATANHTANVASLNENMDAIFLTYYPIGGGFIPRSPSTVSTDMAAMVLISGSKPIVMQEWGYPSSATLSSSEQNQADFVTNTFSSWASHGSTKFPFISFFKRREWNACECAAQTGGGSPGQAFYEFMCSLGLLNNNSSEKSANQVLTTKMSELGIPH
ncbi:MAG: hypothetical protein ABL958_15655 [Bdellovibrionia bacterium]